MKKLGQSEEEVEGSEKRETGLNRGRKEFVS